MPAALTPEVLLAEVVSVVDPAPYRALDLTRAADLRILIAAHTLLSRAGSL